MPFFGYPRIDLKSPKLAAIARFCSLRHLDLDLIGIDKIMARYAKAPRRDLFDRAVARIAIAINDKTIGVFAAFTRVAFAAKPIHRDRQGLVRFLADRTVRHRSGLEAFEDFLDRLDFLDRDA